MPSLHDLQRAFGNALLYGNSAAIEAHVYAGGVPPQARVRIYRNNTRENFLAALRASYPVLERLVGADYFRQMAFDYRERHPSPSGNVHHVGEQLPGYLARRFADSEYRYFPHVAALEWAYQEVMVAAEHAPLDLSRLQSVDPDDYARLTFRLHPAVRLVSSPFPVWTIWNANQSCSDATQTIDLDSGAQHVLLVRTSENIELRRIDVADYSFLKALADGATLAQAMELAAAAAAQADTDTDASTDTNASANTDAQVTFDVGASLRRHVADRVIVDFTLPDRTPLPSTGDPS